MKDLIMSASWLTCLARVLLLMVVLGSGRAYAQDTSTADSPRIALVIGIGAYKTSPLPTAANDAGLVAQTLAAAGFDVTGARDLDGASLRRTIRDFLDKASAGGPRGIAVVYLAGHALQADGENYFAPSDAALDRASGVAIDMVRIADLTRALASTTLGAKVVIVDGAHGDPRHTGSLAGGVALVDAEPGTLLAFNAAPGTLAPIEPGPYGTYAKLLTQGMKQGGVPVDEIFDRLRVAVNTATNGSVVPWNVSKLLQEFTFFDRAANAPALGSVQVPFTSLRTRPLKDFSPEQAYDVALARDTFESYQDYLTVFPDHPLARRIQAILAIRREAMFWRSVVRANSPTAYWTYLRCYPKAPHGAEAGRRLVRLAAGKAPPAGFAPLAFDVPPPPEAEVLILDRRGFLMDPDLPPPPPPPLFLLPPPPPDDGLLRPPPPAPGPRFLPIPLAVAIPFVRPIIAPGAIVPPHGVSGTYLQPRPFVPGSANGGLVPRRAETPQASAPPPANPAPPPLAQTLPVAPVVPLVPKAPTPPTVPAPIEPSTPDVPGRVPAAGEARPLPKPLAPHPATSVEPVPPAGSAPPVQGAKGREPHKPKDKPTSPLVTSSPPGPRPLPTPVQPTAAPPAKGEPKPSPTQGLAPAVSKPRLPAPAPPSPTSVTPPPVTNPRPLPVLAPKRQPSEPKAPVAPVLPRSPAPQGAARPGEASPPHAAAGEAHRSGRPDCGHPGQARCQP